METFCSESYFEQTPDDYKNTDDDKRIMINGPNGATSIPVTVKPAPNMRLTEHAELVFWSEIQPTDDGKIWDLVGILKVEHPNGATHWAVVDFDFDSAMLLDSERCAGLSEAWETFKEWREDNMTEKKDSLKHA